MTALVLERIVPGAPREVFDAWLDPRALAVFMCPAAGMRVSKVEVDARVGGGFLIMMVIGEAERPHRGEYLEISRYTRLAFTWRSAEAGDHSHVRLDFDDLGADQTRLTLTHERLVGPDAHRRHAAGWTQILDALAAGAHRP